MNLTQKISYNFLVSSLARVIGLAFALVSLGFITRALGSDGYGQYALVLAFLGFFQILADFGLQTLMVREISKPQADERSIVSHFFSLRLFLSIFFLALAPLLVLLFPYGQEVKKGVVFAFAGYLFFSQTQILQGIFQKYLRTDRWAVAEIAGRIAQLGLFYFGFRQGLGLFWFLGVFVISSFIIFIFSLIFSRAYVSFSFRVDFNYWKGILKQAAPIAAALIFTFVYFKIDTLMLGMLKTEKDVGIYNLAYKVLEGLIAFPVLFVGLMVPLLSSSLIESCGRFKRIFQSALYILITGAVAGFIVGWLAAPLIIKILGGGEFSDAVLPLRLLLFACSFIFIGTLVGQTTIILGKQKKAAWAYGLGALFNILANLIFIPKYSYVGAAGTTVATEFLVTAALLLIILAEFKKLSDPVTKQENNS